MAVEPVYLSKTRVNLHNSCPHAYYLKYHRRVKPVKPEKVNVGKKVHKYIESYYKQVRTKDKKLIAGHVKSPVKLSKTGKGYVTNFAKNEASRWKECVARKPDNPNKYFYPVLNEEVLRCNSPYLVGVIDRLHWDFDDELVIVENKTGKPRNARFYKNDLLWYKLLVKLVKGWDVSKGWVYFTSNNSVREFELKDSEVEILMVKIERVRREIEAGQFLPTPSKKKCRNCFFKGKCVWKMA